MRAVSWKFSGKCNLCLGKIDPKTKNCFHCIAKEDVTVMTVPTMLP